MLDRADSSFPPPISAWTLETVERVLREFRKEADWFDYKLCLKGTGSPEAKKELQNSIRKTAVAMANINGGYIIFGVKDKGKLKERIQGLEVKDFPKELNDILGRIQPNIRGVQSQEIKRSRETSLWIAYIPPSIIGPHMLDGLYFKRMAGSNSHMDAYEVREAAIYSEEKIQKTKIFILHLEALLISLDTMERHKNISLNVVDRIDVSTFRMLSFDISSVVSVELLEECIHIIRNAEVANKWFDYSRSDLTNYVSTNLSEIKRRIRNIFPELEILAQEMFGDTLNSKLSIIGGYL